MNGITFCLPEKFMLSEDVVQSKDFINLKNSILKQILFQKLFIESYCLVNFKILRLRSGRQNIKNFKNQFQLKKFSITNPKLETQNLKLETLNNLKPFSKLTSNKIDHFT